MNKQELKELLAARNDDVQTFMTWQLEKRGGHANAIRFALDLIDQLDEPEITEEQAWRVIAGTHNQDEAYWLDAKNRYINSINDSELPEVPIIPQWMADIIESERYNRPMLALDKIITGSTVFNRKKPFYQISKQFDDYRKKSGFSVDVAIRNVMRAISSGYTIKPPKTLQVIVKNYDSTVFTTELPEDEAMKLIEGWKENVK